MLEEILGVPLLFRLDLLLHADLVVVLVDVVHCFIFISPAVINDNKTQTDLKAQNHILCFSLPE